MAKSTTEEEQTVQVEDNTKTKEVEGMLESAPPIPTVSKRGSISDSSDSDSEEENDGQQNLQLQALEAELSSNPSNYDAHVQYIKLLRKMAELEKLRHARETMSSLFPLTPEMWQEWTKDEASISFGHGAAPMLEKLYEQGVHDYLSVPLWCDYIHFIQEYEPSVRECAPDGILKARNLFERALTAAGLHVAEGSKIWDAYREYEQAILCTIGESDTEAKEKQVQHIRSIFHRQLSVPLADLSSTLLAYKSWEVEVNAGSNNENVISSKVASSYQKALDMYNARASFEEQITANDSGRDESGSGKFHHFMAYLRFEQSCGDPARVQVLYERAISRFPVSTDLWLDYTRYLDRSLKVGKVVRGVYSRALKNCPWVGQLWIRHLLVMERCHASEKEISGVFENSLQCTFSTLDEYLDVFLTRVDGLRRRISCSEEIEGLLYCSVIRETFQRAVDYLSAHLKNTVELVRLHAYWARLELKLGNGLVAARGVWESLLKICGSLLEAWQGYIATELELGHINEARSIYKRCYTKKFPGTGSEEICHSWLRFEREFGMLEDYDHASVKVTPRLEELKLFKIEQESRALASSTDQLETHVNKTAREKRKPASNVADKPSSAKRQKVSTQFQAKVLAKDKGELKKSAEEAKVVEDNVVDHNTKLHIKDSEPKGAKLYTDQCTAFLSNLSIQATEDNIRQFFNDVGGVVAIRLLKDKVTRKSRGLAYVDFSSDQQLAAAVAKNKLLLLEKRVSIARSDPTQKRKPASGRDFPNERANSRKRGDRDAGYSSRRLETKPDKQDGGDMKGKVAMLFVPRNVRAINKSTAEKERSEKPKSNDEFREEVLLEKFKKVAEDAWRKDRAKSLSV